ncbi:MAG: hypothetical protein M1829_004562 [Trizodia sp. TS-e1964]|nr:MAG: hypothetical protein M1829_004562 [Trizodia sp. TS-e1964]
MTPSFTSSLGTNYEKSSPAPSSTPKAKRDNEEASDEEDTEVEADSPHIFSPDEEASLLARSTAEKTTGNAHFHNAAYLLAIESYTSALRLCPTYLSSPIAILHSNLAACHLQLQQWPDAQTAADACLAALENAVASDAHEQLKAKARLRRAKARENIGGWSALQGALDDYSALEKMPCVVGAERRLVLAQLAKLPPKVKVAQELEVGEMMGKLKQLGNGILKPFGLSTDNFNVVKDEKSGGYSMQFNQGAGK